MIDCGKNWLRRLRHLNPDAIVVTHAHPDHAFGLKSGSPGSDFKTLATDVRELIKTTSSRTGESIADLRQHLGEKLEAGRKALTEKESPVRAKAEKAKATAATYAAVGFGGPVRRSPTPVIEFWIFPIAAGFGLRIYAGLADYAKRGAVSR